MAPVTNPHGGNPLMEPPHPTLWQRIRAFLGRLLGR